MLPKDPVILLSFINMKLRDQYSSIEDLCSDFNIEKEFIDKQLNNIGYEYVKKVNQYK